MRESLTPDKCDVCQGKKWQVPSTSGSEEARVRRTRACPYADSAIRHGGRSDCRDRCLQSTRVRIRSSSLTFRSASICRTRRTQCGGGRMTAESRRTVFARCSLPSIMHRGAQRPPDLRNPARPNALGEADHGRTMLRHDAIAVPMAATLSAGSMPLMSGGGIAGCGLCVLPGSSHRASPVRGRDAGCGIAPRIV